MATRDVPLPLRPDQVENLSGPAGALLLARTTLRRMLQGWLQQRPLHPGARRKDEEHCLPESIALRERSQFGLCIYFEHNNKVHNNIDTLDDLIRASLGSFAGHNYYSNVVRFRVKLTPPPLQPGFVYVKVGTCKP